MSDSAKELPRQELLLKMLNMTTSDNDGVALVALRKANALLASAGWSWESLLRAKITVVADPFATLATPTAQASRKDGLHSSRRSAPPPSPSPASPRPQWGHSNPPPLRRTTSPSPQLLQPDDIPNRYGGGCYCCGNYVSAGDGRLFKPSLFHPNAPSKLSPVCLSCNGSGAYVGMLPIRKRTASFAGGHPTLNDL